MITLGMVVLAVFGVLSFLGFVALVIDYAVSRKH